MPSSRGHSAVRKRDVVKNRIDNTKRNPFRLVHSLMTILCHYKTKLQLQSFIYLDQIDALYSYILLLCEKQVISPNRQYFVSNLAHCWMPCVKRFSSVSIHNIRGWQREHISTYDNVISLISHSISLQSFSNLEYTQMNVLSMCHVKDLVVHSLFTFLKLPKLKLQELSLNVNMTAI